MNENLLRHFHNTDRKYTHRNIYIYIYINWVSISTFRFDLFFLSCFRSLCLLVCFTWFSLSLEKKKFFFCYFVQMANNIMCMRSERTKTKSLRWGTEQKQKKYFILIIKRIHTKINQTENWTNQMRMIFIYLFTVLLLFFL